MRINWPTHETLIVVVHAHTPALDIHVDLAIGARGENFDLSLHLHSYFVCASSEGSSEHAHLHRLT